MLDKKVNINKWKKDFMPEICMLFLSIKGRTPGVGRYWSGCAQASRWSLEISGIAAIDVDNHFAFHLEAVHEGGPQPDENLLDWYGHVLYARKDTLAQLSSYIVADTYFAKKPFVDKVLSMQMHLISRLRDDVDLKYLFTGERTGQRGRPRKHDGKIDWTNLNHHHFSVIKIDQLTTVYSAIVHPKSFKRNIKIACEFTTSEKRKITHKIYFSTDLEMEASDIINYCRSRFQIEFLYRDGKQHTGLDHPQARSENKLHFHFNTSLTSINIARVCHWLQLPKEQREAFSMADIKTLYHNMLLLERFIHLFAVNPNKIKNQDIVKELIYYGTIAA